MVRWMYRVDVYLRVRRAVMVEGKSIREVSREFGLHRDTVRKMLAYSVPPGYRRQSPPKSVPNWSPSLVSSTGSWRTTSGVPGSSATRHQAHLRAPQGRIRIRRRSTPSVKDYVRENRRWQTQGDVRAAVPSAGPRPVRLRRGPGGHRRRGARRPTASSSTCLTATGAS